MFQMLRVYVYLPDCLQCIHKLPCSCYFTTPFAYIPPHLENCYSQIDNETHATFTHVANLAVLSHFFTDVDLGDLAADTLLDHHVYAILPNITSLSHNYSSALASIDKTRFQLAKAANLSIKRQIAFRSMAEFLSHKKLTEAEVEEDSLLFTIPSTYSSPMVAASMILSIVSLVFAIILGIKVKTLSLLFLNAKTASALPTTLNYFHTTPSSPTTFSPIISPTITSTIHSESRIYDVVIITILLISALVLGFCYFYPKYL